MGYHWRGPRAELRQRGRGAFRRIGADGRLDQLGQDMRLGDLRAALTTGPDGRYWFRSVRPCSYPVPTDGPAGSG
jgi:hypothetical protein